MTVGICHIALMLHDNRSLKGKRHVLKRVIEGLKNRFNAAVSEVGSHDLWQRAEIGIAVVGSDGATINSALDKMLDYIDGLNLVDIVEHEIELINCPLLGR